MPRRIALSAPASLSTWRSTPSSANIARSHDAAKPACSLAAAGASPSPTSAVFFAITSDAAIAASNAPAPADATTTATLLTESHTETAFALPPTRWL